MSTLSERYVWGVMRSIPEQQRADLEPEIRALVADAVEAAQARAAADAATNPDAITRADVDTAASERAALTGLGDPELLAARYMDRSLYLIGPAYFLDYKRLLTLLLSIVVPIVTLATMAAGFIAEEAVLTAVINGLGAGFMVGLQLAFWITVGFAAVERYGSGKSGPFKEWTLDDLPQTPAPARLSASDAITSIVGGVVLLLVIAWGPPFITTAGGTTTTVPFFDPALASTWAPWFVVIAVAQIAFAVIVYAARRWNWPIAIVNAVLDAAFVIPAVWLLQTGQLLSPQFEAEMERIGAGAAIAPTVAVISVVLVAVFGWDAIDGFLKAHRARRGTIR
jgi:hypothetical protein